MARVLELGLYVGLRALCSGDLALSALSTDVVVVSAPLSVPSSSLTGLIGVFPFSLLVKGPWEIPFCCCGVLDWLVGEIARLSSSGSGV